MHKAVQTDHESIKQAILDYVEGLYESDPSRIERSVHPTLNKGGYYVEHEERRYGAPSLTFEELVELSRVYNKDRSPLKEAPKAISIFDALDQIATAKLVARWGTDYIHLAKCDNKWMIVQILWEACPVER